MSPTKRSLVRSLRLTYLWISRAIVCLDEYEMDRRNSKKIEGLSSTLLSDLDRRMITSFQSWLGKSNHTAYSFWKVGYPDERCDASRVIFPQYCFHFSPAAHFVYSQWSNNFTFSHFNPRIRSSRSYPRCVYCKVL